MVEFQERCFDFAGTFKIIKVRLWFKAVTYKLCKLEFLKGFHFLVSMTHFKLVGENTAVFKQNYSSHFYNQHFFKELNRSCL